MTFESFLKLLHPASHKREGVQPELFSPAEVEVMRRASLKMVSSFPLNLHAMGGLRPTGFPVLSMTVRAVLKERRDWRWFLGLPSRPHRRIVVHPTTTPFCIPGRNFQMALAEAKASKR
jgi:hypothetical protein